MSEKWYNETRETREINQPIRERVFISREKQLAPPSCQLTAAQSVQTAARNLCMAQQAESE